MTKVKNQEVLIPCEDWNDHTDQLAEGFEGVHGGLFEFVSSFDLVVTNLFSLLLLLLLVTMSN